MKTRINLWIKSSYHKVLHSIGFFPALIALGFLGLSILSISFDFSQTGIDIKSRYDWIRLKDSSAARSIVSVIAAGVISLTVFSFSMVMIVLNQTASQMSNRILDKLIGSRFQQFVLGMYLGTIVYSLSLLSIIRDLDSGVQIPTLSTYLLILITVIDLFLFIYFLHYITQTVKYEVIIQRIHDETFKALKNNCTVKIPPRDLVALRSENIIPAPRSGVYEGFIKPPVLKVCDEADAVIYLMHPCGKYMLKGTPLVMVDKKLEADLLEELQSAIILSDSESIDKNFAYGIRQLSEVALKALSPGINDPGTAKESLRALFQLLAFRLNNYPENTVSNEQGEVRVLTEQLSFEALLEKSLWPIFDYGKDDRMIQHELLSLLEQLLSLKDNKAIQDLLKAIRKSSKKFHTPEMQD